jgi:hypothetical protein
MKSKHALFGSCCGEGRGFPEAFSRSAAEVLAGDGFSVFYGVGSRVFNKSNNPKGSIEKFLQKYKNFQAKIPKNQAFSIALIDKLIYNRICVNIVDKCMQMQKRLLRVRQT